MRKYVELFITKLPHGQALGIELVSCDTELGRCVVRQPWREDLVGDPETGVLHGGVITALLDTLGAACVIARGIRPQGTLDLRIDYLRPATTRIELIGDAECYRVTRHIAFVRGTCHQGDPTRAVASLTATFVREESKS
ncbi:MAG: thioesterase family protein [Myxococcaceae bacterium]|nr:thioesterase family protein [Myxococcaceae bacterium]